MRRTPPLIVGGGPAGSAAAIALADAGARPLLIERKLRAEGIVCGGFLSWDTLASLKRLGVAAEALGAHPIGRARIVAAGRTVEARLPAMAAGLSRLALDEALIARAVAAGAEVRRGTAVTRVNERTVELGGGELLEPEALFVATGKHALRGRPRDDAPAGSVGFRTILRGTPDLAGVIELHFFRGGYAGLLLQEDGRANLCLSVSPARLREAGGKPDALLAALKPEAPRLIERVEEAGDRETGDQRAEDWATIAGVPYGWRTRATAPGCFRIGDQAAVIASVVGDGMGIALASGRSAAEALLRGETAENWQRGFAQRAARPLAIAEAARHVAERPGRAAMLMPWLGRLPGAIGLAARLTRIGH